MKSKEGPPLPSYPPSYPPPLPPLPYRYSQEMKTECSPVGWSVESYFYFSLPESKPTRLPPHSVWSLGAAHKKGGCLGKARRIRTPELNTMTILIEKKSRVGRLWTRPRIS